MSIYKQSKDLSKIVRPAINLLWISDLIKDKQNVPSILNHGRPCMSVLMSDFF